MLFGGQHETVRYDGGQHAVLKKLLFGDPSHLPPEEVVLRQNEQRTRTFAGVGRLSGRLAGHIGEGALFRIIHSGAVLATASLPTARPGTCEDSCKVALEDFHRSNWL